MAKSRSRGNTSGKIDRELLHEFLWEKSGRNGIVQYRPSELANMLGVAPQTMSNILKEMCEREMLTKSGSKYFVKKPKSKEVKLSF